MNLTIYHSYTDKFETIYNFYKPEFKEKFLLLNKDLNKMGIFLLETEKLYDYNKLNCYDLVLELMNK